MTSNGERTYPSIAWDGKSLGVAWLEGSTAIKMQRMTIDGDLLGPVVTVTTAATNARFGFDAKNDVFAFAYATTGAAGPQLTSVSYTCTNE